MASRHTDQTALDERVVEDAELEAALNDREVAKGKKGEATKKFNTLDEVVRDKLAGHNLVTGDVIRVGRFRIEQRAVAARSVEFETASTSRLNIRVEDGD